MNKGVDNMQTNQETKTHKAQFTKKKANFKYTFTKGGLDIYNGIYQSLEVVIERKGQIVLKLKATNLGELDNMFAVLQKLVFTETSDLEEFAEYLELPVTVFENVTRLTRMESKEDEDGEYETPSKFSNFSISSLIFSDWVTPTE